MQSDLIVFKKCQRSNTFYNAKTYRLIQFSRVHPLGMPHVEYPS